MMLLYLDKENGQAPVDALGVQYFLFNDSIIGYNVRPVRHNEDLWEPSCFATLKVPWFGVGGREQRGKCPLTEPEISFPTSCS